MKRTRQRPATHWPLAAGRWPLVWAAALVLGVAIASAGEAGAAQKARSKGAKAKPAAAPRPAVPETFAKVVARETRSGLQLLDGRSAAIDRGDYFVAVYRYPRNDPDRGGRQVLKLYFQPNNGGRVKSTELQDAFRIGFGTPKNPSLAFADVNQDGWTDLIVNIANGDTCLSCQRVLLYSLEGPELRCHVSQPMEMRDLNGDGRMELLVTDERWGRFSYSRAAIPQGTLVYTWRFGGFVFAGPDFPEFYRDEIAALEAGLPASAKPINAGNARSDERYVRDAISILLAYTYSGQAERGRQELRRLLDQHVASEEMRQRREQILDDFLNGARAETLKEPRRGQQLPLP